MLTSLFNYRQGWDASGGTFPTTGGSGTLGAILAKDTWVIAVPGPLGIIDAIAGDLLIANIDTPGQTPANWDIIQTGLGYVPEDVTNKENVTIDTSTTKYPTINLLGTVKTLAIGDILGLACSDVKTSLTPTLHIASFVVPYDCTFNGVFAALTIETGAGNTTNIDINYDGVTALSTILTIDSNEPTSLTALTPVVISVNTWLKGKIVTIDLDQVASTTPGKGLVLIFDLIKTV